MISIFWILTISTILFLVLRIIIKKDYFSLNTYILLGVYLPLVISTFDWSTLHVSDRPSNFYMLFCIFDIIAVLINILPQKSIKFKNIEFKKKNGKLPIELYNLIYIIAILIENYYVSGYFFPSKYGIDIHTARMPYIYFITTGIYIVSAMNLVEYFSTKKKRYIIYILGLISLNIITKSSRIDAFICATQLSSIILVYFFNKREIAQIENIKTNSKKGKVRSIIVTILIFIIIVATGLSVGKNRMNSNGKYDIRYSDGIEYKGPETKSEIIAYYYGYFPLSFDNLAYNMKNTQIKPNYIGLSSFRTLYFGVFQFDNLFKLDGGAASKANYIRSKAAAVATGFWDFYYDYGNLYFIPIIISFFLYYILKLKLTKDNPSALSFILYFYWIPLWFFLSFDNRIYDYQVLIHIIIMSIIIPKRYVIITDSEK